MLKPMTWATWVKKIVNLIPIEKKSQFIKTVFVDSIISSIEKEIPKTDLYTQAGCILDTEFCRSLNPVEEPPIPELNSVAKKAELLLQPPKKPVKIPQKPSTEPELCETYVPGFEHDARMEELKKKAEAEKTLATAPTKTPRKSKSVVGDANEILTPPKTEQPKADPVVVKMERDAMKAKKPTKKKN